MCLEIIEGIVFASAYISPGAQTTCYKSLYLFPEYAEDLAQRIFEGRRGGRVSYCLNRLHFPRIQKKYFCWPDVKFCIALAITDLYIMSHVAFTVLTILSWCISLLADLRAACTFSHYVL